MLFVYIVEALLTAGFASRYPDTMPQNLGRRPKECRVNAPSKNV